MRKLSPTAAALAIAAATLTGTLSASPAQAATLAVPSSCASRAVCGYNETNFNTGSGYAYVYANNACEDLTSPYNWSSLYNNSGRTIRVYKTGNCTGDYVQYANGGSSAWLPLSHPTFNNNIRSVRFV